MAKASIIFVSQYAGYKVKHVDANGKTQQMALGKSQKLESVPQWAIDKAVQMGFDVTKETPVAVETPIDATETLNGWVDVYLSRKANSVRPDTMPNLKGVLREFQRFATSKGLVNLDSIDVKVMNEWVDQLNKSIKPSSVVTKLKVVSGLFTMAVKENRINDHPVKYPLECASVALSAFKSNQTTPEIKYLTPEQQERYWDELDKYASDGTQHHADVRDLAIMMAFTGLRIKAAANLTFENIDADFISVPKPLDKGKKGYSAFIFERAKEMIERRRLTLKSGRIFPGVNHRRVWHWLRTFSRHAGIDILEQGHFCHILRHTHAVNLVNQGVSLQTIQQQLGHSDISTTQVYAKMSRDTHRAMLKDIAL